MSSRVKDTRALMAEGRFVEALECCRKLLAQSWEREVVLLMAEILSLPDPAVSDPGRAVRLIEDAISRDSKNAELLEALGDALRWGMGDYPRALNAYRQAVGLAVGRAWSHYSMAELFEAPEVEMSLEEAIGSARTAVRLEPRNWEMRRTLAKLLWRKGDYAGSAAEYSRSLDLLSESESDYKEESARQLAGWLGQVREGAPFQQGYYRVLEKA